LSAYVFDLERSARGLRINRFLHSMTVAARRARYAQEPEAAMAEAGLTPEEMRMLRELDWHALMQYGASFFCLEKFARVRGVSNPEIVAAFRRESLEAFLATRKVPGAR
jgi:gallate dioxygenase